MKNLTGRPTAQLWRAESPEAPPELLSPVVVADTLMHRTRGLIGRGADTNPMYFPHTPSVHGAFLKRPLDVALLDRDGVVIGIAVLRPWRVLGPRRRVAAVLEATEGSFRAWGLGLGQRLSVLGHDADIDD